MQNVTRVLEEYAGKKIAVGVSGGRDSMCLLHAVLSCRIFDRSDISVLHVNHGLRAEADGDENFVRGYCEKNGVAFRAYRVDVKRECREKSLSVEQAARDLRYGAFRSATESGIADVVLVAHHALDNAESVLMHMFRGSGPDGLCGMRVASGFTVRPLLDTYPEEIEKYVADNGIEYVVDGTNFIDDADRNYIRVNVLPLVMKRYGGAVRAINALASDMALSCAALDGMLDSINIVYGGGCVSVKDAALESPLATRYMRRALAFFSLTDVTRDMLSRAAELVRMRTGATVPMNNGVVAAREYGCVTLFIPRAECDTEKELVLGRNYIDGLAVCLTEENVDPKSVRGGAVDIDKLDGATLRFRRDGDYFTPCGGKRKKLKQFFIDGKICKRLRDRTPLVCRGSEVLVIVGVQISDEVKIDENTVRRGVVRLYND